MRTCTVPLNKGQCSRCGFRGHDLRNCPRWCPRALVRAAPVRVRGWP